MPSHPSNAGPTPPAILRACAGVTRLNAQTGMALADELMVSNPDFISHALALAHFGVAMIKVDAALRVAFFLELCYRGQAGKPLPLFSPEEVDRHRRKTLQSFSVISGLAPEKSHRAGELMLATQPQIPVTSWMFKLLADAGVTAMRHDDDIKIMTCAYTLLSLYHSAFPPESPGG